MKCPLRTIAHVSVKTQYLTRGHLTCYPDDCGFHAGGGRGSEGDTQSLLPPEGVHMITHLPLSFSFLFCCLLFFPSIWRLTVLRFSRLSSSWKSSFTLWLSLAEVSMKAHFHLRASASASLPGSPLFSSEVRAQLSVRPSLLLIPRLLPVWSGRFLLFRSP